MEQQKNFSKKATKRKRAPLSKHHHMTIRWDEFIGDAGDELAIDASLKERAAIVGRIGILMLACGTGAWRVRNSMNSIARVLGLTCTADVGLVSIEYTCVELDESYTQTLALATSGVNTSKLTDLEWFVREFERHGRQMTISDIHYLIDQIRAKSGLYKPPVLGLAAALACSAFVFLLGGGLIEMICAFIGAGFGNYVRAKMNQHKITLFAGIFVSVAVACLMYMVSFRGLEALFLVSSRHEAGYIGAMLFVIPGFPFITSGLDIAKLDMRSGLERMAHALMIIIVATMVGWLTAMSINFKPEDFIPLQLTSWQLLALRLPASFCGVFGFSLMFNSSPKLASTAGVIGALANTLRLELVDFTNVPPVAAAFVGALLAGLLASILGRKAGYPRISLTVPAIVIMVPGLYMYRAVYNIGLNSISVGAYWLTQATLIVLALPLGLIAARILTDPKWRYSD